MSTIFRVGYFLSFLLLISFFSPAQDKVEVERRVDATEVPTAAQEWVSAAYEQPRRLRWIHEESGDGLSYEAKLKHQGRWHSVEFGEDGQLQDIEIIVRTRELPNAVRQPIRAYLDSTYARHRIKKIQRQLTGPPDVLQQVIRGQETSEITVRYEIEFYGKDDQEKALWEGLFDDTGRPVSKRRIVLRPTDNLTY